ncbi:MAG: UxaA family hydrolase [Verrucomicrobia bacterium]|nr:UxaA family hydrolase [Verrucomicrobiota bacterium]
MNNSTLPDWPGYVRPDGQLGIRNLLLVVYTVECSRFVAEKIAAEFQSAQVIGFHGCYDNPYAVRQLLALARHPNVGAVLFVGLGCEYTRAEKLAHCVQQSGKPAESFLIQANGGTLTSVLRGKERLSALKARADLAPRCRMNVQHLTIGCECGGSDSTSGLAGNPLVGKFFDHLVDAGGTALFEETVEMIGLENVLTSRAASPSVAQQLSATYAKAENYCQRVRQYSASPGNYAGGLTTIEEKSLGAFAKSGSRPIQGVIRTSTTPPHCGLWLLDTVPDNHYIDFGYTNPNDSEGITALVSCGCHIVLFVTGRGSLIGSPIAPLIKVTANGDTFQRMQGDIDFDASGILAGTESLEAAAVRLQHAIVAVASGQKSCAEALGHHEYLIPYKFQNRNQPKDQCHS